MPRADDVVVPLNGSAQVKREQEYAKNVARSYWDLMGKVQSLLAAALPDAARGAAVFQLVGETI